ncbi:PIN domain-containing protein [Acidisoma silvae]|uniref:Ribonuclease VapC n=1 Tax=Acidisoma silvae TaxID=2802396 RepID=A0A963YSW7_9PROT|nr:PIN domain-containing protein [Acidisoma silvae]MCB8876129.1 PIN domain-containing protein [Acidisoma silvae]
MYLVDTNVISTLAPTKVVKDRCANWIELNSDRLFISAITIMEVEDGIAKAARTGATQKAKILAAWLEALLHLYGDRVIALDARAAAAAGRLMDKARGLGIAPDFADLAIAGTAEAANLTILTRNLRHFVPLGLRVLDPWHFTPSSPPAPS